MTTATQNAPNDTASSPSKLAFDNSEALKKISAVPLVSDSLTYAHSTIQAHRLLATTFGYYENIFNHSLKAAEPITSRLHPQLAYVDSLAAKSIDFAERKWSYPFHVHPQEIIDAAKLPADQARNYFHAYSSAIQKAYGERVINPAKNVYDNAHNKFDEIKSQNAYLQRAAQIVKELQGNLAKTIEIISSRGKKESDQATRKAQGISNAIFAELERVRHFTANLPAEGRKRVRPVMDTFTDTYEQLNKEARNPEVPATTRFVNVVKFVREQSLPALQKALVNPFSSNGDTGPNGTSGTNDTNGTHAAQ